jgi:hypothetical protein
MSQFIINSGNLRLEEVEVKGEKKDYVKGFISTDDLDLVNDVVSQKCFDSMMSQLKDRTIKLDFEHEAFRGDSNMEIEINKTKLPLGKRVDWQRKSNGVEVTWELNPTWKQVNSKGEIIHDFKDIKYNLKNGFYDAFSICFIPRDAKNQNIDGKDIRLLDDLTLLNVALTGNAVNPKATISEIFVKSLDSVKEGPGGHKPDGTGPNGRGKGPGKGKADGSGLEEEETEETEEKKKKKEKKDHSHNDIIKLQGGKKMSEEKEASQSEQQEESKEKSEEVNTSESEEKSEDENQVDAEDESPEVTSEENAEVKSLRTQVDALSKDLAEVKALLKKPVHKGQVSDMKEAEAKSLETSYKGPLDAI